MSTFIFFRKKRSNANSIEEVFKILFPQLHGIRSIELPYSGASLSTLWKNMKFARKNKGKINHITGDVHYIAMSLGKRTILTIHDVGSALNGNLLRKFIIRLFWFWLPALYVCKITVISDFTKKELSKIIPFAKHKIQIIHNAFNPKITFTEKTFNEKYPVILHIGTKKNKNLERTIEALSNIPCILVIIGKLSENQLITLEKSGVNYENYFDLDYAEIIYWYNTSDIVSFPSTYEGFGVPILEANAAGRPVVAGNVTAIPEIAGNAACLVDPFDIGSIRSGFMHVINHEEYRKTLVSNGFENIKRFDPQKIAQQYQALYEEVSRK